MKPWTPYVIGTLYVAGIFGISAAIFLTALVIGEWRRGRRS